MENKKLEVNDRVYQTRKPLHEIESLTVVSVTDTQATLSNGAKVSRTQKDLAFKGVGSRRLYDWYTSEVETIVAKAKQDHAANIEKAKQWKLLTLKEYGFYSGVESERQIVLPFTLVGDYLVQTINELYEYITISDLNVYAFAEKVVLNGHAIQQFCSGSGKFEAILTNVEMIEKLND